MSGRGWLVIVFVLVLGGLAGGYVAWQTYALPASASRPAVPQEREFSLVLATVGTEETGQFRRWMPSAIVVNAGDTVVLKITNADPEGVHGFALPVANLFHREIPSGQTVTVRFVAARPGIYMFACAMAGCAADHAAQKGQLIVLGR
jgi:FtsP/CotA-like multicopper oxidase with cupredoxin domain